MSDTIRNYQKALDKYEKEGNADKVLELIRKMVEIAPEHIDLRIKLAEIYLKRGWRDHVRVELEGVERELKKAIRGDNPFSPGHKLNNSELTNAENLIGIGESLMLNGEFERAGEAFTMANVSMHSAWVEASMPFEK